MINGFMPVHGNRRGDLAGSGNGGGVSGNFLPDGSDGNS